MARSVTGNKGKTVEGRGDYKRMKRYDEEDKNDSNSGWHIMINYRFTNKP